MRWSPAYCVALLGLLASCAAGRRGELELLEAAPPTADLIVIAGRVHSLDPRIPAGEAVALRRGRILAVATRSGILRFRGTTTRVEVFEGAHVFPGFGDGRVDLAELGRKVGAAGAEGTDATSVEEARLLAAQRICLEAGLTRVHSQELSVATQRALQRLAAAGRWKLGVFARVAAGAPHGGDQTAKSKSAADATRSRLRFVSSVSSNAGTKGSRGSSSASAAQRAAAKRSENARAGSSAAGLAPGIDKLIASLPLALGSGAPDASVSLLEALHAMASSADPSKRLSPAEALVTRTRGVAWAAHEQRVRGRIAAGFEGDLTIVDRDLTAVPIKAILAARVVATIIGGELAWQRKR